ncbi:MAG: HAMP domain-containing histidine kinase [Pirellulales bacterium]|nr:HAMP domain-containing histidine kinase [Pirellulales bacterium]
MKTPWQVWTVFGVFLAVVIAGMAWLSVRAIDSDRAEAAARQRAEQGQRDLAKENRRVQLHQIKTEHEKLQTKLEKNIGQALWRMDSFMIPLLAQESFLPHTVYEPFQPVAADLAVVPAQSANNENAAGSQSPPNPFSSQPTSKKSKQSAVRWVPSPLLVNRSPYVKLHFQYDAKGNLSSPQAPGPEYKVACSANGIEPAQLAWGAQQLASFRKLDAYDELIGTLPEENLPNAPPLQSLAYNVAPQYIAQSSQPQQIEQSPEQQQGSLNNTRYKPIDRQMRGGRNRGDYAYRNTAKQQFDQAEWSRVQIANDLNQEIQSKGAAPPQDESQIREGVSAPKWIGDTLVLARRVEVKDAEYIQGLEFDWPELRKDLLADVEDLLPDAKLKPVHNVDESDEGRMLATLPVKLVVPPLPDLVVPASILEEPDEVTNAAVSPIWATLGVAWSGVILASLAVGGLLLGVVRLSERRAAFVSSVTHELRTPLTTFRMYAEMLAEDMITSPEQRETYLQTLTSEADRLTHLVDNVLTYSRIERGRGVAKRERTTLGDLLDNCQPRLLARTSEADMQLVIESEEGNTALAVETDSSVVEQILFNLVDNACKYAQGTPDNRIEVRLAGSKRSPQIVVEDHGPGLSRDAARKLFQPFSKSATEAAHSAPGVGLGLALSRRLARTLGGDLRWQSGSDGGAAFTLSLPPASK